MQATGVRSPVPTEPTVEELERELEEVRAVAQVAEVQAEKYRKAADHLAKQCAEIQMKSERERAALIEDHDAFIVELTEDHDRLIAGMAKERDEARELASEAVTMRDGVAEASKRLVRERTQARRELGEVLLERDVARRDAARAGKQLADAKREITRLQQELLQLESLYRAIQGRRPSQIPMPDGQSRSSRPPPVDSDE